MYKELNLVVCPSLQGVERSDGQLRQRDAGGLEDVAHALASPAHPQPQRAPGSCTHPCHLLFVYSLYIYSVQHTRINLYLHGQKFDSQSLDLSDDEELREQMDMHSIIVSCINDEPLFTAEQVTSQTASKYIQKCFIGGLIFAC